RDAARIEELEHVLGDRGRTAQRELELAAEEAPNLAEHQAIGDTATASAETPELLAATFHGPRAAAGLESPARHQPLGELLVLDAAQCRRVDLLEHAGNG